MGRVFQPDRRWFRIPAGTPCRTTRSGSVEGRVREMSAGSFQQAGHSIDAAFSAMDRNKDGRISKEEAIVVPEIAKYFAGLDTDGDGYLSLREMQQAMVAAQTADAPTK
ncbi:EF-hand domain-containing protein [Stenotrophomonas sp. SMYL11]|uniref:EF-hand domain-containing protein n=1 Tax=Stenotrophomonas sp. SMYL11 TaxID=3076042 RepID=UPI002E784897|nr:EF-hand domain-containing protein [Stenotrophomonas sp. SMYL11]